MATHKPSRLSRQLKPTTQSAPLLLLLDRLPARRLIRGPRYRLGQDHPLHPSHRPRERHLVRLARLRRGGLTKVRRGRGQVHYRD